jgi:hypothetical protein
VPVKGLVYGGNQGNIFHVHLSSIQRQVRKRKTKKKRGDKKKKKKKKKKKVRWAGARDHEFKASLGYTASSKTN